VMKMQPIWTNGWAKGSARDETRGCNDEGASAKECNGPLKRLTDIQSRVAQHLESLTANLFAYRFLQVRKAHCSRDLEVPMLLFNRPTIRRCYWRQSEGTLSMRPSSPGTSSIRLDSASAGAKPRRWKVSLQGRYSDACNGVALCSAYDQRLSADIVQHVFQKKTRIDGIGLTIPQRRVR
jgi:hypothetical protein